MSLSWFRLSCSQYIVFKLCLTGNHTFCYKSNTYCENRLTYLCANRFSLSGPGFVTRCARYVYPCNISTFIRDVIVSVYANGSLMLEDCRFTSYIGFSRSQYKTIR